MHKVSSAQPILHTRDVKASVQTLNSMFYQLTGVPEAFTLQPGRVKQGQPYLLTTHTGAEINLGSAGLQEVMGTLRGIASGLRLTAGLLDGPELMLKGNPVANERVRAKIKRGRG